MGRIKKAASSLIFFLAPLIVDPSRDVVGASLLQILLIAFAITYFWKPSAVIPLSVCVSAIIFDKAITAIAEVLQKNQK